MEREITITMKCNETGKQLSAKTSVDGINKIHTTININGINEMVWMLNEELNKETGENVKILIPTNMSSKIENNYENKRKIENVNLNEQINSEKKERILDAPSKYSLSEIFKELKFGRPAENQVMLDKFIDMLECNDENYTSIDLKCPDCGADLKYEDNTLKFVKH